MSVIHPLQQEVLPPSSGDCREQQLINLLQLLGYKISFYYLLWVLALAVRARRISLVLLEVACSGTQHCRHPSSQNISHVCINLIFSAFTAWGDGDFVNSSFKQYRYRSSHPFWKTYDDTGCLFKYWNHIRASPVEKHPAASTAGTVSSARDCKQTEEPLSWIWEAEGGFLIREGGRGCPRVVFYQNIPF